MEYHSSALRESGPLILKKQNIPVLRTREVKSTRHSKWLRRQRPGFLSIVIIITIYPKHWLIQALFCQFSIRSTARL